MKTIGLIGGMSWESSLEYYRIINKTTQQTLGGLHSAKCILYSVDFAEIETLQHQNHWSDAAQILIAAGQSLERAGADFLVLCTNTMHKLADDLTANLHIPLLHIADATATKIQETHLKTVGLLGTRFTMEQDFYKGRLMQHHGLNVLIPNEDERALIHQVIYQELCQGIIHPTSKQHYLDIIYRLAQNGAEGIILGCTEIELLVQSSDTSVALFPTTRIHAEAAAKASLTSTLQV